VGSQTKIVPSAGQLRFFNVIIIEILFCIGGQAPDRLLAHPTHAVGLHFGCTHTHPYLRHASQKAHLATQDHIRMRGDSPNLSPAFPVGPAVLVG
jgi:hypothetical protein